MEAVIWADALSFRKPDCRFSLWFVLVFGSQEHQQHLWPVGSLSTQRGSACLQLQSTVQDRGQGAIIIFIISVPLLNC